MCARILTAVTISGQSPLLLIIQTAEKLKHASATGNCGACSTAASSFRGGGGFGTRRSALPPAAASGAAAAATSAAATTAAAGAARAAGSITTAVTSTPAAGRLRASPLCAMQRMRAAAAVRAATAGTTAAVWGGGSVLRLRPRECEPLCRVYDNCASGVSFVAVDKMYNRGGCNSVHCSSSSSNRASCNHLAVCACLRVKRQMRRQRQLSERSKRA